VSASRALHIYPATSHVPPTSNAFLDIATILIALMMIASPPYVPPAISLLDLVAPETHNVQADTATTRFARKLSVFPLAEIVPLLTIALLEQSAKTESARHDLSERNAPLTMSVHSVDSSAFAMEQEMEHVRSTMLLRLNCISNTPLSNASQRIFSRCSVPVLMPFGTNNINMMLES